MSQVSVGFRALAYAAFDDLNSGDLDAFLALKAEDVEFTSVVAEEEARSFRGHAGVRAWWQTVHGGFGSPRWEQLDIRASDERGVVKLRVTVTLGDGELAQIIWMAARLREGEAERWGFFRTEHEALEAAGPRE